MTWRVQNITRRQGLKLIALGVVFFGMFDRKAMAEGDDGAPQQNRVVDGNNVSDACASFLRTLAKPIAATLQRNVEIAQSAGLQLDLAQIQMDVKRLLQRLLKKTVEDPAMFGGQSEFAPEVVVLAEDDETKVVGLELTVDCVRDGRDPKIFNIRVVYLLGKAIAV